MEPNNFSRQFSVNPSLITDFQQKEKDVAEENLKVSISLQMIDHYPYIQKINELWAGVKKIMSRDKKMPTLKSAYDRAIVSSPLRFVNIILSLQQTQQKFEVFHNIIYEIAPQAVQQLMKNKYDSQKKSP